MNFKRIDWSNDFKRVGSYPQVQSRSLSSNSEADGFIGKFILQKAPLDAIIPTGILHKKAKFTDLISASAQGFSLNLLVSERLGKILAASAHYGIQFFETSVILPSQEHEKCSLLHPYAFGYSFIDYKKSEFIFMDAKDNKKQKAEINSIEEILNYKFPYKTIKESGKSLWISKLHLIDNIDIDFFALNLLPSGGIGFFVSETLENFIIQNEMSGFKFVEI
ncbi:MAG TPA: hypothetical protein DHW64_07410 [Chitinophagaceae bacterium]|nr:hypothetical protein [Chitinophagaceae bacterium]